MCLTKPWGKGGGLTSLACLHTPRGRSCGRSERRAVVSGNANKWACTAHCALQKRQPTPAGPVRGFQVFSRRFLESSEPEECLLPVINHWQDLQGAHGGPPHHEDSAIDVRPTAPLDRKRA